MKQINSKTLKSLHSLHSLHLQRHFSSSSLSSSFQAKDIRITKSLINRPLPDYTKEFGWGTYHTDHMLEIDHDVTTGWGKPYISEYHNLSIDPRNQTLHYATELFEGMKAFRSNKDVYLFRPDLNMLRMNRSAARLGLPAFDGEELTKCIASLIKVDERWVHYEKGFSLYIRPTFISMSNILGVQPPKNSKIFVILSPVGPYFSGGVKPIRLVCNDSDYIRAFKGGFGEYKLGANYGPTLQRFAKAVKDGFNHVLWLTEDNITEAGVMNFFYVIKTKDGVELLTAKLDGTILPGVTRQSVMDVASEEFGLKVTERTLPMKEFIKYHQENKIVECFCTGTAATIIPIKEITYQGVGYKVLPDDKNCGDLAMKMLNHITRIQFGEIKHKFQRQII